jgi:hypothetical protein
MSRIRITQFVALTGVALLAVAVAPQEETLVAQDGAPSFAREVAPILYQNCTTCHRPGGLAPFSLLDYATVKAHRAEIRDAVEQNYMPPWHADGPRGEFRNDRRLSDDDKQTLMRWLDAGARKGSLKGLPPAPTYATGWELGTPDAIVSMPEHFTVPASGTVEYQYFEIPTGFTEDKWIQAIEFMPGAREVGEVAPPRRLDPQGRGSAEETTPRDTERAREAEKRATEDSAREERIREAEAQLEAARDELANGKEPLPGERIGTAGGNSRLTEAYFERQESNQRAVTQAQEELDAARVGR